jgi:hypothetical protein
MKLDRPGRCFVNHPYLFSWIETDLSSWLSSIASKLPASYTPHDPITCYSPKPGWMVRPGAVLDLADELVFNAVLGNIYSDLLKSLQWAQGDPDIAYQLVTRSSTPAWVKSGFFIWTEWRKKSLDHLTKHTRYVVFADIAGFYPNIELSILYSDLNSLGIDQQVLDLLRKCLDRWSKPRGRGVPQGYTASDLLAKLYMNPIDLALRNSGFDHLRYVDDIRIFCRSSLEAKQALLKLTDVLRNRGLNLQTSKTEILPVENARGKIDGVKPFIDSIQEELKEELRDSYGGTYATVEDMQRVFNARPGSPPPEVLERAFAERFSLTSDTDFDATLFHYLLTRLGKTKSRIASEYCISIIRERPEETEYALRYLTDIDPKDEEQQAILKYARSSAAIYDYQLYQILRWFFDRGNFAFGLLAQCRSLAFDRNRSPWIRSYAIAILGKAGDPSDIENIEASYASAVSEVERAEIVRALAKMEVGRRNAFFKRVGGDGFLIAAAVNQARCNI